MKPDTYQAVAVRHSEGTPKLILPRRLGAARAAMMLRALLVLVASEITR
ncbi:hypothetical protein [Nonomuraea sediminis]|nr:hypothetical protein [Nonomuraea sediminis]